MYKPQLLKGIEVRPSMEKFKGRCLDIGIVRCATPSPAYLNRQIIMMLSCLDVPDEIFLKKIDNVLKNLNARHIYKNVMKTVETHLGNELEEVKTEEA